VTTGHPAKPESSTAEGVLGLPLGADEVRNCLACHTTDFRASRDQVGPTASEPGIGCERCHGPGGNHLKAIALGFPDPAIARPKRATAEQVTRLCAECHGPSTRAIRPGDPNAVRFQGTTLTWSRCYQESRGGMSCVTCHDPHHDADRRPATYEAKCLACHPARTSPETPDGANLPSPTGQARGAPCPVNPSGGCVTCHMPATRSALPHTTFTDHHIRPHRPPNPAR
jgi:formate-dependent nitrite reductase cytochrome c552 subunit